MFVAKPYGGRDVLTDPGLFFTVVYRLQMRGQFGDEFAKTDALAFFKIEQLLIDQHHGPDLTDVTFEYLTGYAITDERQLQTDQAVQ